MDNRIRAMAGELYGTIKNDTDARRAKRMVQWFELAMGSALRSKDVGDIRHVLERRAEEAEEAALKRARVETEDGKIVAAIGAKVDHIGDVGDIGAVGEVVDSSGKGKEFDTSTSTTE